MHATVYVDARARGAAAVVRAVRPDPAADAGFVGRATEMTELLTLLAPHPGTDSGTAPANANANANAAGGVVVVSAVAGAPGVGKTALAHAAARAAVTRGWFPGGAVTVDLHGYDPDPAQVVWPTQLYPGLLRALGVSGEQIPPEETGQATVYHQVLDQLAEAGRAVLVVLDNVGDPDQVAALLPHATGGHRALVTSRDSMARLLGARLLDLHVLDPDAAVHLLDTGLRRRDPADRRVTGDPGAAGQLVELCGRLPLAVQIVAALLADEPDRPLTGMVADLTDEQHRWSPWTTTGGGRSGRRSICPTAASRRSPRSCSRCSPPCPAPTSGWPWPRPSPTATNPPPGLGCGRCAGPISSTNSPLHRFGSRDSSRVRGRGRGGGCTT